MVEHDFPSVRLVRSPVNLGFGIATNRLAATSTATHLLLLNPDTRVEGPLVGPLLGALEADPAIAVAGRGWCSRTARSRRPASASRRWRFELARELRGTRLRGAAPGGLRRGGVLPTTGALELVRTRGRTTPTSLWATCWLLRRADVEATGLLDPRFPVYDEDLELCSRLRERGRRLVYVPDAEVVHLGGASSTSARKQQLVRAGRARWYRRHRGPAAALAYTAIVRAADAARAAGARARGA